MEYKRLFIIEIEEPKSYIKEIYKTSMGYFCIKTRKIINAKKWKYKKNCDNSLLNFLKNLDPTKDYLKNYKFKIIEITDTKILRNLKLKKLNKNENKSR